LIGCIDALSPCSFYLVVFGDADTMTSGKRCSAVVGFIILALCIGVAFFFLTARSPTNHYEVSVHTHTSGHDSYVVTGPVNSLNDLSLVTAAAAGRGVSRY